MACIDRGGRLGDAGGICGYDGCKPYNWLYWDIATRKAFYCSQLVWAAFKDKVKVNLNTSAYSYWGVTVKCTPGQGCKPVRVRLNPVHPMELVQNSLVDVIWHSKK